MKTIVIVGGGAAGMMAAVAAAGNGENTVILLEKNEKVGKKLFITGKGRCNLTNACDTADLFLNIISNPKFLYSSVYGFDNLRVMQFFEDAGLKLKTERGGRVFPESDHSSDVLKTLEREMRRLGVRVNLHTTVTGLEVRENRIIGIYYREEAGKRDSHGKAKENRLAADSVIMATGGLSYPRTGSTGDGLRFAKKAGHSISETYPSLVPFETKETWCKDLMGLSLKNVSLSMMRNGKEIYNGFGEMLFTHFGISGPLVLSASAYYHQPVKQKGKRKSEAGNVQSDKANSIEMEETIVKIDLKPALTAEQLDARLSRDFLRYQNRNLSTGMQDLLPKKLIPIVIREAGIDPEKKIRTVTKEERLNLVETFKGLTLRIKGTRSYDEAIITKGGISVKEVDPSTMESKLVKGLYFAGECLDVDALTGGFNLQIAWSTGYAAGLSAAEA